MGSLRSVDLVVGEVVDVDDAVVAAVVVVVAVVVEITSMTTQITNLRSRIEIVKQLSQRKPHVNALNEPHEEPSAHLPRVIR